MHLQVRESVPFFLKVGFVNHYYYYAAAAGLKGMRCLYPVLSTGEAVPAG